MTYGDDGGQDENEEDYGEQVDESLGESTVFGNRKRVLGVKEGGRER